MIEIKVIKVLRFMCVPEVSLGFGTFRQMADHVERKMVAPDAHRMSRVPRLFGEDVHPCNGSLVLFVPIPVTDPGVERIDY